MNNVNITLSVCGIILTLIVLYGIYFEVKGNAIKNRILRGIAYSTLLGLICNILAVRLQDPVSQEPSRIFLFLGFITFFIWFAFLILYRQSFLIDMGMGNWKSTYFPIFLTVIDGIINIVLMCSNSVFVVSNGNVTIKPFAIVIIVLNLILMLAYVLSCFKIRKIIGSHDCFALIVYILVVLFSVMASLFLSTVANITFGMSVSLLICYIMVQNKEIKEKTQLLLEANIEQEAQIEETTALNEELTALNEELDEHIQRIESNYEIINSISRVFYSIHYIDLESKTFVEVGSQIPVIHQTIGSCGRVEDAFEATYEKLIRDDYKDIMRSFCDISTVNERLKDKIFISTDFYGTMSGWAQGIFIAGDRDDNGNLRHVFWAVKDNNDEKNREIAQQEELSKAIEEAQHANHAKTTFLNNMSHDIRTPMNAILGFTQLMEKEADNKEVVLEYLSKIEIAGDYLLTIINNILDIARIDSGKVEVDRSFTDLFDKDSNVLDFFESDLKQKNLSFSAEMDIKHQYVFMDMIKCRQIMVNLVSNAIKYTPENGHIKLVLREEPAEEEGYARFITTLTDDGIGMSKEFQEEIFDSFSREHNTTESKVIGTGLGMSIVKRLVDLMDGSITVESELGRGTTFTTVFTHRICQDPEKYLNPEPVAIVENEASSVKRILVAEDNNLNAEIAIAILEGAGFEVELAEDGVICVDMINRADAGYYDLILMDIQMPNMNGYEATSRIRQLPDVAKANIPIFAMTANAFDEDKKKAFEMGMNGHIAKPIKMNVLLKEIAGI